MINAKCLYSHAIQRYSPTFSVLQANVNLHLRDITEIQMTEDEAKIINALRGLNGKKAKLAMFKIYIEHGGYTFDQLAGTFPTYRPDK